MSHVSSETNTASAIKRYVIGFVMSIALTLLAFMLVFQHINSHHAYPTHETIIIAIIGFAVTQLIVQMVFFLHLGQERRPRWNLNIFLMMLIMLGIIVFGSLWIMDNLSYHMMSSEETKAYMKDHEGL